MTIATSKLTKQGQISVPAKVRRKLGLEPGSVLEWVEEDGTLLIRRATQYSSKQIHDALFSTTPPARSPDDMKAGIRELMRTRHARD